MIRLYDTPLLCEPIDMSKPFGKLENIYFIGERTAEFKAETGAGTIQWERFARKPRFDFDKYTLPFERTKPWEFPEQYVESPSLPFSLTFVDDRTVRIRLSARNGKLKDRDSLMLEKTIQKGGTWSIKENSSDRTVYNSKYGSVTITNNPWRMEFHDSNGRLLTRTNSMADRMSIQSSDPTPFCFVRSVEDMGRSIAASFSLSPGEKLYGAGESFLRLDKRGQKVNLFTYDPLSAQTADMYKPIPFFFSSRGYGMFFHHSCPITCDFGHSFDGANTIYIGEDQLDLFFFFGGPKEVLYAYTELTGRSKVPPLWSFGLWMSRITYQSEEEVRDVAAKLRKKDIPCDVIHLDTGWFEEEWRCNYLFSSTRFEDPEKMISDLRKDGFRISLWQYPYFMPSNELYEEIIDNGYAVTDGNGILATEDAVLDLSNPEALEWYQSKIASLLNIGVSAIKVDFGESAPIKGQYYSGKNGWLEHNLYPLRYNKAVSEITEKVTGDSIIWARSAWAGSQRYPIHWGGDVENTNTGMAASLRAGLSLGLSGFSFWSHDIGGFVHKSPRELYRRWMPFGMLTSHSRCHGAPPKEPWYYDEEFVDDFRKAVELKYKLMPYIYTQAVLSAQNGLPLLRPLFLEFPEDMGSWAIEDQYLLGTDLLVAPLFDSDEMSRNLYLPAGKWIDYQSGKKYSGAGWYTIEAGEIPIVMLIKEGAVIPHLPVSQSTAEMDWNQVKLISYGCARKNWQVAIPNEGIFQLFEGSIDFDTNRILFPESVTMDLSSWKFNKID